MGSVPPPIIATAKLLKFAIVTESVTFTGKQRIYVDEERIAAAPRLAICRQISNDGLHLYLCNERWEVIAVSEGKLVADLMERAEHWYSGITGFWVESPYSDADYDSYLEHERGDARCSFCGRWDWQYSALFSQNGCNLCDVCVRSFHSQLPDPAPS